MDRPNYCYGCNGPTGNAWICDECGPAYWGLRGDGNPGLRDESNSSFLRITSMPPRSSPDDPMDDALSLRIMIRRAQLKHDQQEADAERVKLKRLR